MKLRTNRSWAQSERSWLNKIKNVHLFLAEISVGSYVFSLSLFLPLTLSISLSLLLLRIMFVYIDDSPCCCRAIVTRLDGWMRRFFFLFISFTFCPMLDENFLVAPELMWLHDKKLSLVTVYNHGINKKKRQQEIKLGMLATNFQWLIIFSSSSLRANGHFHNFSIPWNNDLVVWMRWHSKQLTKHTHVQSAL